MRQYEVVIMESNELDRIVKVYIKLPYDYHTSNKEYPVLYINDGNVVFNDFEEHDTGFGLVDDYMKSNPNDAIFVGIGSGKTRVDEMCPFEFTAKSGEQMGGKTPQYMSFITETLMPFINKRYRTKVGSANTGLMGVSFGGLCTFHAVAKYNDIFGRFVILSSAFFQFQEKLIEEIKEADLQQVLKIYSDVGTLEHEDQEICEKYVTSNKEMYEVLREKLNDDVFQSKVIEGSKHEFEDWNKRTKDILTFIFSD